jgi:hypothetical protein
MVKIMKRGFLSLMMVAIMTAFVSWGDRSESKGSLSEAVDSLKGRNL